MHENSDAPTTIPAPGRDVLTEILRDGAQRLLGQAIEAEVDAWIEQHARLRDERGHQQVVRNGHHPPRTLFTGVGPVEVKQPRVLDRRIVGRRAVEVAPGQVVSQDVDAAGQPVTRFSSKILPPYLRKTKAIEELIPWLYLKGVSTGDFGEALQALVGPQAAGLSATTITRLMTAWQDEHQAWSRRSLAGQQYVYLWADGVHFNIRLEEDRQCILVLMGATAEGKKELLAVLDGHRESEQSWYTLLLDCKQRGLEIDPKLATADGALGFWKALPQVWPTTREQRCWVHKTANVLDKMAKRVQPAAKQKLHEIWMAPRRVDAEKAFDNFIALYEPKYPQAVECLKKDRDVLLTFYDFPAEHWIHLRTTNPIESTFATVRLRHRRTKGNGSRGACLAMVFKLCESAARHWRLLNGAKWLADVIAGIRFIDGEKPQKDAA
ncbi:MAG TPA: IS256 family transposase [Phycisphaerae bacterium]|jgi:transposase-like protein|nr:IS256 family transposase [Phycisphaerae bacterium]